jgi:predicted metal-binding membrane protein
MRARPNSRPGATRHSASVWSVWIGMAAIAALNWLYLARMGGSLSAPGGGMSAHAGMAMGEAGSASFSAVLMMWAVMMMAMMLPTVAPSARVYAGLAARRQPQGSTLATAIFVAAYTSTWVSFAVPAALLQGALTQALLLDPMARSTSAPLSAVVLFAAGLYQFTPLKTACLSTCRSPLAFFMASWRDGAVGALRLGWTHGSYCVACCWALMAVMFVVGAMNLAWMGLLTLLVLGEKVMPAVWRFDQIVGTSLILAAVWVAVGTLPAV